MPAPDVLDFTCPRCGDEVNERFYGPCTSCRSALATLGGEATGDDSGQTERFEPKMHVTPNHVATKD